MTFKKQVHSIAAAYQSMYEKKDLNTANAEKALRHDCATHVEHSEYGKGTCIPGQHTLEEISEGEGIVTHYDVMFTGEDGPFIVEDVPVKNLKVHAEMSHGHKKKK